MEKETVEAFVVRLKKTLEREECALCNHRRATVAITMTERGPRLKMSCCCFSFEQKLHKLADALWLEYKNATI